ncbi:hypothetical protein HDU76_001696 [Blyttiomyces sp. JEL0837]|nr:hypothetical protein HDU76_001696 [Blyttiomyces sp. JEL0837]
MSTTPTTTTRIYRMSSAFAAADAGGGGGGGGQKRKRAQAELDEDTFDMDEFELLFGAAELPAQRSRSHGSKASRTTTSALNANSSTIQPGGKTRAGRSGSGSATAAVAAGASSSSSSSVQINGATTTSTARPIIRGSKYMGLSRPVNELKEFDTGVRASSSFPGVGSSDTAERRSPFVSEPQMGRRTTTLDAWLAGGTASGSGSNSASAFDGGRREVPAGVVYARGARRPPTTGFVDLTASSPPSSPAAGPYQANVGPVGQTTAALDAAALDALFELDDMPLGRRTGRYGDGGFGVGRKTGFGLMVDLTADNGTIETGGAGSSSSGGSRGLNNGGGVGGQQTLPSFASVAAMASNGDGPALRADAIRRASPMRTRQREHERISRLEGQQQQQQQQQQQPTLPSGSAAAGPSRSLGARMRPSEWTKIAIPHHSSRGDQMQGGDLGSGFMAAAPLPFRGGSRVQPSAGSSSSAGNDPMMLDDLLDQAIAQGIIPSMRGPRASTSAAGPSTSNGTGTGGVGGSGQNQTGTAGAALNNTRRSYGRYLNPGEPFFLDEVVDDPSLPSSSSSSSAYQRLSSGRFELGARRSSSNGAGAGAGAGADANTDAAAAGPSQPNPYYRRRRTTVPDEDEMGEIFASYRAVRRIPTNASPNRALAGGAGSAAGITAGANGSDGTDGGDATRRSFATLFGMIPGRVVPAFVGGGGGAGAMGMALMGGIPGAHQQQQPPRPRSIVMETTLSNGGSNSGNGSGCIGVRAGGSTSAPVTLSEDACPVCHKSLKGRAPDKAEKHIAKCLDGATGGGSGKAKGKAVKIVGDHYVGELLLIWFIMIILVG